MPGSAHRNKRCAPHEGQCPSSYCIPHIIIKCWMTILISYFPCLAARVFPREESSTASGLEGACHCIHSFTRAGPFVLKAVSFCSGPVFNRLCCVWPSRCHRLCSIPDLAFKAYVRAPGRLWVPFFDVSNEICDDRALKVVSLISMLVITARLFRTSSFTLVHIRKFRP